MNVGILGHNFLHTTSNVQTAQGLQPAVTPVSQAETLTRINSTQNTSNAENKPNSQQEENAKNADEVANQYQRLGENIKNYKGRQEEGKEDKHGAQSGEDKAQNTAENLQGLSEDELKKIQDLVKRDREVRTHEQAHMAAAGQYANGAIHFDTETGPDGKSYAVGGHVNIDTSPVPNDPQATLRKANKIRAAAMAPADPSSQDRSVASQATQMAAQARVEISKERQQEVKVSIKEAESEKEKHNVQQTEASSDTTQSNNDATSEYKKVAGLDIGDNPSHNGLYRVA